MFGKAEP